jgi:hypothetical protein
MPSLVRRIDATKTHAQREIDESGSAIFLPGGAIDEIGNGRSWMRWHRSILHDTFCDDSI